MSKARIDGKEYALEPTEIQPYIYEVREDGVLVWGVESGGIEPARVKAGALLIGVARDKDGTQRHIESINAPIDGLALWDGERWTVEAE